MGFHADIYIIKKTRSKQLILDFLNHFAPNRKENCVEYYIPQLFNKQSKTFTNSSELLEFLMENPNYYHSIYFENLDKSNPNKHVMLFFNKDESIVFGTSRNADLLNNLNTVNEDECLLEMKKFFNTNIGYITHENPPEDSFKKFIKIVRKTSKTI